MKDCEKCRANHPVIPKADMLCTFVDDCIGCLMEQVRTGDSELDRMGDENNEMCDRIFDLQRENERLIQAIDEQDKMIALLKGEVQ